MAVKTHNPLMTAFWVVCMLLTGTLNTLTTKIQFTMESVGNSGIVETFEKPWFGTLNMVMAMLMVMVVEQVFCGCSLCRRSTDLTLPLVGVDVSPGGPADATTFVDQTSRMTWRKKVLLVAIPAAFDLVATALCCIGIMYIPASVWQMLRGSALIFCALLSVFFLKRKMYAYNWLGLALCVIGIVAVGLANVMGVSPKHGGEDSSQSTDISMMLYGMLLVLAGQVTQAAQVIAEEWLMKDVDLPSVQIIGFEGFWGVLMMIFFVYPLLWLLPGQDGGHLEDPVDTAVMVSNSGPLMACVITYLFSCGTFNITGIQVTAALSATHRMMLDASRTMVIWAFGLYIHYYVDRTSKFGEAWNDYSVYQLLGFFVLVTGQAIYGEVLVVPGLQYPPKMCESVPSYNSPTAALHNIISPPRSK